MKDILCLMLLLLLTTTAKAEQYDERTLLGTWEITEREGTNPMWAAWEGPEVMDGELRFFQFGVDEKIDPSFKISEYTFVAGIFCFNPLMPNPDYSPYMNYLPVADFFISNENKLHLECEDYDKLRTLMFEIESFTDSELKLVSFNGKFRLTLKKVETISNGINTNMINSMSENEYSLNGIKISKNEKGIHIRTKGNEAIKIIH